MKKWAYEQINSLENTECTKKATVKVEYKEQHDCLCTFMQAIHSHSLMGSDKKAGLGGGRRRESVQECVPIDSLFSILELERIMRHIQERPVFRFSMDGGSYRILEESFVILQFDECFGITRNLISNGNRHFERKNGIWSPVNLRDFLRDWCMSLMLKVAVVVIRAKEHSSHQKHYTGGMFGKFMLEDFSGLLTRLETHASSVAGFNASVENRSLVVI